MMNLQEQISRIQSMMRLNEETTDIKAKASIEGLINFFDVDNKKVYRYQLQANVDGDYTVDIFVKSINDTSGDLTYINPQDDSEETQQIPIEQLNQIKQDSLNKRDFNNIFSFKKLTKDIQINLVFVEEKQLQISGQ
jgi:hypothetical protein